MFHPNLSDHSTYIDWDEFKDTLREKDFHFTEKSLNFNCENIDRAICNLTDNIGSTLDEVGPKRPAINRNWRKEKLGACSIPRPKRLYYNRRNKAVKEKINEQKQAKWKEFVSGIEAETNVATFWKKFKSYSNSRNFLNAHEVVYQPLEQDNQETKDDHSMLREISVSEIIQTLQKHKNRSDPGEDNIILNSKKLI